jgi:hypothetical protein
MNLPVKIVVTILKNYAGWVAEPPTVHPVVLPELLRRYRDFRPAVPAVKAVKA